MLLIITKLEDPTADYVIQQMSKRGVRYVRLNSDLFGEEPFYLNSGGLGSSIVTFNNVSVNLSDIRAVWLRRLVKPLAPASISDSQARDFAAQERDFTLRWLLSALPCPIIDRELDLLSGRNKFHQLEFASKLGLETPSTLITNDPKIAREFIACYPKVIVKTIAGYGRRMVGGFEATYTQLITPEIAEKLDSIGLAPVCFQVYIEKSFELRITIVGERIFGCQINSQDTDRTSIDWRRYDPRLRHSVYNLQKEIGDKLLAMMRHDRIHFASFDLVVTPEGKIVFLEMNPGSQFVWIEKLTGMPITDALINLLLEESHKHNI